jgi:hypothetical protein
MTVKTRSILSPVDALDVKIFNWIMIPQLENQEIKTD